MDEPAIADAISQGGEAVAGGNDAVGVSMLLAASWPRSWARKGTGNGRPLAAEIGDPAPRGCKAGGIAIDRQGPAARS